MFKVLRITSPISPCYRHSPPPPLRHFLSICCVALSLSPSRSSPCVARTTNVIYKYVSTDWLSMNVINISRSQLRSVELSEKVLCERNYFFYSTACTILHWFIACYTMCKCRKTGETNFVIIWCGSNGKLIVVMHASFLFVSFSSYTATMVMGMTGGGRWRRGLVVMEKWTDQVKLRLAAAKSERIIRG